MARKEVRAFLDSDGKPHGCLKEAVQADLLALCRNNDIDMASQLIVQLIHHSATRHQFVNLLKELV